MALQESEGTPRTTLGKLRIPGGARAGYVMIGRTDIDFTNRTHTTLILSYVDEQARRDDIQSAHPYFIGGPLTEMQMDEMKTKDVREVLYPEVARLINDHASGAPGGRLG